MKYSIKDFFTFTEEILNEKLNFLCSASCKESVSSSLFNGDFPLSPIKSLRELLTITGSLSYNNKCKSQIPKKKRLQ